MVDWQGIKLVGEFILFVAVVLSVVLGLVFITASIIIDVFNKGIC